MQFAYAVRAGLAAVATLLLTRRPLRKMMRNTPVIPSNAPTVIGKRAVVVVTIEEGPGQRGQVRVGTEHWSARAENEQAIPEGTTSMRATLRAGSATGTQRRSVPLKPRFSRAPSPT